MCIFWQADQSFYYLCISRNAPLSLLEESKLIDNIPANVSGLWNGFQLFVRRLYLLAGEWCHNLITCNKSLDCRDVASITWLILFSKRLSAFVAFLLQVMNDWTCWVTLTFVSTLLNRWVLGCIAKYVANAPQEGYGWIYIVLSMK